MKDLKLDKKNKINPGFEIPENYFEQFEAKMMQQIPKKEVKVVALFHRKQLWISSIAAVLLVMIAIPVYFNMSKATTLETATLETYLSTEYSTYEF